MGGSSAVDQAKIERDGYRWFFMLGLVAVGLAATLWAVDDKLSYSDSEKKLGETLHELRTAQTTLPGRVTDTRQTLPFLHREPVVTGEVHADEHHGH